MDSAGARVCNDCLAGKYSAAVGAQTISTCLPCPANSHAPTGSSAAAACRCNAGYSGPPFSLYNFTFVPIVVGGVGGVGGGEMELPIVEGWGGGGGGGGVMEARVQRAYPESTKRRQDQPCAKAVHQTPTRQRGAQLQRIAAATRATRAPVEGRAQRARPESTRTQQDQLRAASVRQGHIL